MTNKERFLAGEIFLHSYKRYQFAEHQVGRPFIRTREGDEYKYFCNIETMDDKKFIVFNVFFGKVFKVTIEFKKLEFIEQEGGAQQ